MAVHSIDAEDDQFAYRYDTQLLIDRRDEDLDEDEEKPSSREYVTIPTEPVKEAAKESAQTVKDTAEDVKDAAKSVAENVADAVSETAQRVAENMEEN